MTGQDGIRVEDLRSGQVIALGSHPVTEAEIVEFARAWDPQDFHVDKELAAARAYGGLIASGIHTMAVYQRLCVDGVLRRLPVIAGKRLAETVFLRPVRPGDTLTGTMTVDAVEFDDRGRALVTSTGELVNDDGKPVFRTVVEAYMRVRDVSA